MTEPRPSRRGLLFGWLDRAPEPPPAPPPAPVAPAPAPVAPAPAPGRPQRGAAMRPALPGRFTIQESLCLAWKHVGCSTCRERCPVPGAITVDLGRPTIVADVCTGCGDCVRVCPAPILAIRFVPPPRAAAPDGTDGPDGVA